MFTHHNTLHTKLPKVSVLLKKGPNHYMEHPYGRVLIGAHKVNQYKVTLIVDLWHIPYDVNSWAAEAFRSRYHAYLDWLSLKERKGMGKEFYYGVGKTYNTIQVMNKEADDWMQYLWELCSDEKNLTKIPSI